MPKLRSKQNNFEITIRCYCIRNNLTINQLAKKMNLTLPTMYSRLSNPLNLRLFEIKRLAKVLNCSIFDLLNDE